jgi:hypothetical protein
MVKKKASGSKVKKNTNKAVNKFNGSKNPKLKWCVWALFGLIIVILSIMAYKNVVTRRDVALLDSAEQKMRKLEFPGGKEGEIERYCSEKSVKFGSAGKPTCGVSLKVVYSPEPTISNINTDLFRSELTKIGADYSVSQSDNDRVYYDIIGFAEGLECYMGDVKLSRSGSGTFEQHLALYCQKEFQSKVYPIRN